MGKKQKKNLLLSPISFKIGMFIVLLEVSLFSVWAGYTSYTVRQSLIASAVNSVQVSDRIQNDEEPAENEEEITNPKPQHLKVDADYVIDVPGTILADLIIEVAGSIKIEANDVTIRNTKIICDHKRKTKNALESKGIEAIGVDNLILHRVSIGGCGNDGIFLKDGTGHDLAELEVKNMGGIGIVLDGVSYTDLVGVRTRGTIMGIVVRNESHHNRILASNVLNIRSGSAFFITEDSYANQVVRSRNRYGNSKFATAVDLNPDNLWYHNICASVEGYAACDSARRSIIADYGNKEDFFPQTTTVCKNHSFPGHGCDYDDVEEAIQDADADEWFTIDTTSLSHEGTRDAWPSVIISKPLSLIGNTRSQKGTYNWRVAFPNITIGNGVDRSRIRIQNISINKPLEEVRGNLAGVELVNVKAREGNHWVDVD